MDFIRELKRLPPLVKSHPSSRSAWKPDEGRYPSVTRKFQSVDSNWFLTEFSLLYLLLRTLPKLISPLCEMNSCVGIFSKVKLTVLETWMLIRYVPRSVKKKKKASSPIATSHCEPLNHSVRVKPNIRPVGSDTKPDEKHLSKMAE